MLTRFSPAAARSFSTNSSTKAPICFSSTIVSPHQLPLAPPPPDIPPPPNPPKPPPPPPPNPPPPQPPLRYPPPHRGPLLNSSHQNKTFLSGVARTTMTTMMIKTRERSERRGLG